jgi:glycosyltransferase involved in cell wall biosynthesis
MRVIEQGECDGAHSPSRFILVQPTIPTYRTGLFERLAASLGDAFVVYASRQDMGVLNTSDAPAPWERRLGRMKPLFLGLDWQAGAASIPFDARDVIVVPGGPRNLSALVLLARAKLKGARTIWWGHYWSSTSRSWRAAIRFALMRLADQLLFYTDQEVDEYRARTPQRAQKPAEGLNNGIATKEIVDLRTRFLASERGRNVLFIGRLTEKAELETALHALARPACREVTLHVIGDGDRRSALRRRASELGVEGQVEWWGGLVDEAAIAAVANRCALFVYPGGVGLSLIHALAYGLPAIVHDDRWNHMPEIAALQSGVNGLTFRMGDADGLAEAIANTLSDASTLEAMSAAATRTTDQTFNTDDMARRFLDALVRPRRTNDEGGAAQ